MRRVSAEGLGRRSVVVDVEEAEVDAPEVETREAVDELAVEGAAGKTKAGSASSLTSFALDGGSAEQVLRADVNVRGSARKAFLEHRALTSLS